MANTPNISPAKSFIVFEGSRHTVLARPAVSVGFTEIKVHNQQGQKVKTLTFANELQDWSWHLSDTDNSLAPGFYFIQIENLPVQKCLVLGN